VPRRSRGASAARPRPAAQPRRSPRYLALHSCGTLRWPSQLVLHVDELLTLFTDDDLLDVCDTVFPLRAAVARGLRTLVDSIAHRGRALLEARLVETGRLHSFDKQWQATSAGWWSLLRGTVATPYAADDKESARAPRNDADGALASHGQLDNASGLEPPTSRASRWTSSSVASPRLAIVKRFVKTAYHGRMAEVPGCTSAV